MYLKKLQRGHKPQLERYLWKSGPPRATYWEVSSRQRSVQRKRPPSWTRWPSSCGAEVKPGWNLPLPDPPQPAGRGSVRESGFFPRVSGRGSARHLWRERRDGECACVLRHITAEETGLTGHTLSSKPSQFVNGGLPPVAESARWEMRGILARDVV